jgi:uncharacterized membrane protein YoaK (UPF0700 family)
MGERVHAFSGADRCQVPVLVLLTLTGLTGIVDAESFLALGHVFTANMTGNVVLLAFAYGGAPGLSAMRSGTALVAFLAGAALGSRMAARLKTDTRLWVGSVLFLQAAVLFIAAVVAIGREGRVADAPAPLYSVIALTALAMGLQNATALELAVPGLTPNVLTTALTDVARYSLARRRDPFWMRRIASVVTMFAGALVGVWLWRVSAVWPLVAGVVVSAVCGLAMFRDGPTLSRMADPDDDTSGSVAVLDVVKRNGRLP